MHCTSLPPVHTYTYMDTNIHAHVHACVHSLATEIIPTTLQQVKILFIGILPGTQCTTQFGCTRSSHNNSPHFTTVTVDGKKPYSLYANMKW